VRGEAVGGRSTDGGSIASRVGLDGRLERTSEVDDKENTTQMFWRTRTGGILLKEAAEAVRKGDVSMAMPELSGNDIVEIGSEG
jgi:hypothetical protein